MSLESQEQDTTKLIWQYFYQIRLPYLQSRSEADIRRTGVVLSGVREIDKDIPNQWITTMATIATMVDYYKQGVPIKVVNQADIKTIYDSISKHILAWRYTLERGINIGNAPIDDLIAMDQFANVIYDHAKYQFTPEIVNSLIAQHLTSVQRVNVHNFYNPKLLQKLNQTYSDNVNIDSDGNTRINGTEDAQTYPDRESFTEFFKDRLITMRRR